jgi:hypothetical protein
MVSRTGIAPAHRFPPQKTLEVELGVPGPDITIEININ